jgi:hypothetical protein
MRWHARCLSYWQKGGLPRLEGSHASGFENKIAEARRRPYSPASELRIATGTTTTNDDDTPPQNKQATNPVSHNTGFFFVYAVKQGGRGAALRGRSYSPGGEPGGARELPDDVCHPHFESPQFRQVMQPSIITTAAVLHLAQS